MYIKGDYIHQSTNGLCRVEEVTTLDMAGVDKDRLYYKLTPVACQGSTVFIPVEKSAGTTRYAMTREEAKHLITDMPAIEALRIPEERTREQQYKEALLSMDCRNWVKVIKTLYLRKIDRKAAGRKEISRDEQYFHKAEERLYTELAFALGRKKEEMEAYIIEKIDGAP